MYTLSNDNDNNNDNNNDNHKYEKYNKDSDLNKPLNNEEIDKLERVFMGTCCCSFIGCSYSRKNYDLFVNKKIFEPNINNTDYVDDLYYLGIYYQHIKGDYDLMKKYYLLAMEKGNSNAMHKLGLYHQWIGNEKNYKLMKKYYLMAIKKGNSQAMISLGFYYEEVEKNYGFAKKYYLMAIDEGNTDAMNCLGNYYVNVEKNYDIAKKYYIEAIDKGNVKAMYKLGYYYEEVEKNYDLMKKYYLMAINNGKSFSAYRLGDYYIHNCPNDKDLQNYFDAIIRGNDSVGSTDIFADNEYIEKYRIINVFCLGINNINQNINNFEFCLSRIVNYIYPSKYKIINYNWPCESPKPRKPRELKNIKYFAWSISKLLYRSKNKLEYKKCANKILEQYVPQIFMEYLDLYYYEYLKKIFAPGGEGYIKTKKHFELIVKQ